MPAVSNTAANSARLFVQIAAVMGGTVAGACLVAALVGAF
jgi:hypothetical protein